MVHRVWERCLHANRYFGCRHRKRIAGFSRSRIAGAPAAPKTHRGNPVLHHIRLRHSDPEGVQVNFQDGVMTVKGKLGELTQKIEDIQVVIEDGMITFERSSDKKDQKAKHGL